MRAMAPRIYQTCAARIVLLATSEATSSVVLLFGDAATVPMGVPDGGGAVGFLKTIVASIITICVYSLIH